MWPLPNKIHTHQINPNRCKAMTIKGKKIFVNNVRIYHKEICLKVILTRLKFFVITVKSALLQHQLGDVSLCWQGYLNRALSSDMNILGMIQGLFATSSNSFKPIARPCGEHIALRQIFSRNPSVSVFTIRNKFITKITRFWAPVRSLMKGAMSPFFKILGGSDDCCWHVSLRLVWKCVAAMKSTDSAHPTPKFFSGSDSRLASSVNRGSPRE